MTPHGRGFDTSFGYLMGGEDHYTHMHGKAGFGCAGTDLYRTDGPAYEYNNTYGAYLYNDAAVRIILAHNRSQPLFLYMATQVSHGPDQVLTSSPVSLELSHSNHEPLTLNANP